MWLVSIKFFETSGKTLGDEDITNSLGNLPNSDTCWHCERLIVARTQVPGSQRRGRISGVSLDAVLMVLSQSYSPLRPRSSCTRRLRTLSVFCSNCFRELSYCTMCASHSRAATLCRRCYFLRYHLPSQPSLSSGGWCL